MAIGVGRIFFQDATKVDFSRGGSQQWWNFILPTRN